MINVLAVEDSITSRALLKNILEAAGHADTTAVDGMDASQRLHREKQHRRMGGAQRYPSIYYRGAMGIAALHPSYELLAELPVVLVTALESREHRERGIDVGANAYIVKSSFDQSNLLEVVKRLV